jgi:putative DNA primase/helicase
MVTCSRKYCNKPATEEVNGELFCTLCADNAYYLYQKKEEEEHTPQEKPTKKKESKEKMDLLDKYSVYYKNDSGRQALSYYNLAKLIKNEHGYFLLIEDKSSKVKDIYFYKDGYFQNIGERVIRQQTNFYLGKKATKHARLEIMDAFNDLESIERSDLEAKPHYINLNNGVLNIKNMELLPHDPKYRFLNKIPVNYNPKAKCPKIQKFFKQVLREETVLPLQEMFGYTLYRDYHINSIFILRGTGRNGKGVTLRLLKTILGIQNICARKFQEIATDQHARADLYCKFATLSGEMKYQDIKDNSLIKELSGKDVITARRLYKESFEFENYAKLVFSTNNLPPSLDMNVGWLDRIVFFEFPKTFDKGSKKTNENLFNELQEELEGVLIWSLEGLQRLLKKGKFSNQPHYDEIGDLWEKYTNTTEAWYEERIEETIDSSEWVNTALYKDYQVWCIDKLLSPESRISFGRKLKRTIEGKPVRLTRKLTHGYKKPILEGVKLKKIIENGKNG